MSKSIEIKVINTFTNPLSYRKLKKGEILNVPHNQFWIKRLSEKDCELVKTKTKAKKSNDKKADVKNIKGSN